MCPCCWSRTFFSDFFSLCLTFNLIYLFDFAGLALAASSGDYWFALAAIFLLSAYSFVSSEKADRRVTETGELQLLILSTSDNKKQMLTARELFHE
jgi:positive regulator of sigma E activity